MIIGCKITGLFLFHQTFSNIFAIFNSCYTRLCLFACRWWVSDFSISISKL